MPNLTVDVPFWYTMLKIVIVLVFGLKLAHSIYLMTKTWKDSPVELRIGDVVWRPAIWLVLFIVAVSFAFIAMGPGTEPYITPAEDDGMHQIVEQGPEEKSPETLKKEAYDSQPEQLKRQDSTWHKEADEADAYIEKALKKADDRIKKEEAKVKAYRKKTGK